ncbi:flagellar assembly protein FliW [Kurthia senegalensis]|uniref:flagellar assembly protein FliW n=1 Tax=Kurthia senegalensis TaxID=1033740 RepID=UPI000288FD89|nr:flagellar assembly protein FliW [Kurthia senegalensis]
MNIQTKFLGEVTIQEQAIITFPEGIPGFQEEKQFVLIPLNEASPFLVLQSIHTQKVGFMVATPYAFKKDYAFDLQQSDVEKLEIERAEDVLVYGILTLKDTLLQSTINLLAPVVINEKKQVAKQIVLPSEEDLLHFPLKSVEGSVK